MYLPSKMLRPARRLIRRSLRSFGYDICLANERRDPFADMKRLVSPSPTIFDVGANVGQTVNNFRESFQNSHIHAFEPGRVTFTALKEHCGSYRGVTLNNMALGSSKETRTFLENEYNVMSSFLEIGSAGWGAISERNLIEINTVDDYCDTRHIEKIDILKSDTQGFDLEVLKGAERIIARGGVYLVYLEINFAELYQGLPPADEIMRFLREHGFSLVSFYRFYYINNRVGWTDGLFRYSN
jgi:FkbM family methyltransferase